MFGHVTQPETRDFEGAQTAERAARIPENVARQTPLPVRVFDLENQRLVDVPKP